MSFGSIFTLSRRAAAVDRPSGSVSQPTPVAVSAARACCASKKSRTIGSFYRELDWHYPHKRRMTFKLVRNHSHWDALTPEVEGGRVYGVRPFERDPDPSILVT